MRLFLSGICLLITTGLMAQSKTTIYVINQDGAPVANATIELEKTGLFVANDKGVLTLSTRQTGTLICRVSSIGYTTIETPVELPSPSIKITLTRNALFLDPVEIKALRAGCSRTKALSAITSS